jgi:polyhydroxyalkanoate synthesis regulator phasin
LPPVELEPTQDPTPEPETSSPESLTPILEESPSPDPDLPSTDLPSDNNITETTDEEINTLVEDFSDSGSISDAETEQLIDNFLNDGFISEDEVSGLSDSLTEDGILTEDEKELLVDVILEQADGNAISTELIDELGLDYEDLPDDQPVALENGVILFAEVADALEIFENPSEILGAVFTDPGKALTAVANIGADMTPEKREESQKVVVASVITVQVVAATNLATGRIR